MSGDQKNDSAAARHGQGILCILCVGCLFAATNQLPLAIDHNLATDPHLIGRHIFDTLYEYDYPPLGVEFEVIDADRQVLVLTCWSTATGRPAVTGN